MMHIRLLGHEPNYSWEYETPPSWRWMDIAGAVFLFLLFVAWNAFLIAIIKWTIGGF